MLIMKRPKIGIALGSGAVRGMAHIGILKVLEEHDLAPSYITGTSIGSIIGACYASGRDPEWIENFMLNAEWNKLLDFTIPKRGFLEGRNIEDVILRITKNKNFSDLRKPLRVIATDILNHQRVVFKEGNVAKATRASMSIPGVFDPVEIDGKKLVDGALVDPIPTDELYDMGADIVIAVDLSINIEEYYMHKSQVQEQGGFSETLKQKLITEEIKHLKASIRNGQLWIPKLILNIVEPFIKPKQVLKLFTGRQMPEIIETMMRSLDILGNELSKEKLKKEKIDVIIKPTFRGVKCAEFEKIEHCIKQGEIAALKAIPQIRKAIAHYHCMHDKKCRVELMKKEKKK
jgi:predicted acylesterase/phospholipase RssA